MLQIEHYTGWGWAYRGTHSPVKPFDEESQSYFDPRPRHQRYLDDPSRPGCCWRKKVHAHAFRLFSFNETSQIGEKTALIWDNFPLGKERKRKRNNLGHLGRSRPHRRTKYWLGTLSKFRPRIMRSWPTVTETTCHNTYLCYLCTCT